MSILSEILRHKKAEIAAARSERSLSDLERAVRTAPEPRGLAEALRRSPGARLRAIAEIKRASPSAGPIRPGADPADVAREYADAGAAAISVLTDVRYFDGHLSFVERARAAAGLPVLRKDFLVDPYQVLEARAAGADAVLLIVCALEDAVLSEMLGEAGRLGMDALVEIHSEAEAERAVAAGARLIGVNHRDLATLEIDLGLSGRLRPRIPADAVMVAESGIRNRDDVRALSEAGADAILVGESLMRAASPGAALAALLEGAR